MIAELQQKNFDPDPVKKWKKTQAKLEAAVMEDAAVTDSEDGSDLEEDAKDADYDYLLGMAMWSLTQERIDALLKQKGDKHKELKVLKEKTPAMIWNADLDEFLVKLDEVETKEKEDAASAGNSKAGKKGGKKTAKMETAPSPMGIRVAPKIPDELRKKVASAALAKERKGSKAAKKLEKELKEEPDEFDNMLDDKEKRKSLGEKLGFTPEKKEPKKKAAAGEKKSPTKKGGKKKNPWETSSDESADENGFVSDSDEASDFADDPPPPPREKKARTAAAAPKAKNGYGSDSDEDEFDAMVKKETPEKKAASANGDMSDD